MTERRWYLAGLGLIWTLWAGTAAATEVEVVGLFPNKAVVVVDGRRHVLAEGEATAGGVRLMNADSGGALLEVDGEQRYYPLGGRIGTTYRAPESTSVQVVRDNTGMYTTVGSINGRTVDFLVDTGASSVALSAPEARRLGIPYRLEGAPIYVNTASGRAQAWALRLAAVKVGGIELRNVDAVVIDNGGPERALLGMSFLGRIKTRHEGNVLFLEQTR